MGATDPEPMTKDDERSAKKMKDGHGDVKVIQDADDSTEAEKATKPAAMRGNDNKQGDKNAIPSATKDHPANKTTKEQFDAIAKAYSVVENFTHEVDYMEFGSNTVKSFVDKAKKAGIKAKIHTMRGPGGGNPVVHLGHKNSNVMYKFLKKHYDPDVTKDDLEMYEI